MLELGDDAGVQRLHHPALGRASASFAELHARSTPDARVVWDVAGRLAQWRRRGIEQLEADARSDDVLECFVASSDAREPGIGAVDLARALVALHPARIEAGNFADVARSWRARADGVPSQTSALSHTLARRIAAFDPQTIDVDALFGVLPRAGVRVMASMLPALRDGLVTEQEAYVRLVDTLANGGRVGAAMPTVWWERRGLAFDDAPPGHALVGPPLSGKRTLLRHSKAFFPHRGVNVDNFHGAGPPDPKYRASPSAVYAAMRGDRPMLCCWSNVVTIEPELLAYALEVALDPHADLRLMVCATTQEFADVVRRVGDAARLRIVPIAAYRDDELLTVWLCQRPRIEDVLGRRVDLNRMLGRLAYLRRYAPATSILRGMIERLDMTGRAELDGPGWAREVLGPCIKTGVRRGAIERAWERLVGGPGTWILPLIPSPQKLRVLVELDAAITGEG